MRDRQYRESFLPTPLVSVFATCLPLFVFKLEPLCSDMGSPLRDGNTCELRALLAFSVCITAHYGTRQNMSIGKTTDQKVSGSNPLGRGSLFLAVAR